MGIHSSAANEPGEAHERRPIPSPEELRNLPPDGGADYNRLVFEQSPYLLQHAANPVDWYPWGPEAFEKARREDKPVFLSVGYSTCHWCHVMERESFEDPEVAALLNHHFVCIKVDREERPDVDKIYMDVTQAMTGAGGWPMTVVMTPDKKPFFAGTYFPKTGRFGRPGMLDLVPQLAEAWKSDREKVLQIGEQVTGALGQINAGAPGNALTEAALELAYDQFASRYDPVNGGFSQAPKFPVPQNLLFLLRYWKRTGEPRALEMVEHTLTRMRLGGVYDHVGFGFHRYATDAVWLVPHFEKMLYDQALLAMAYVEAFQATGNPLFARTAREVFDYVLRDMTAPGGGFYSAEDADSEGEEGKFYLWSTAEVRNILGEEEGALFINVYHLEEGGNFLEQSSGEKTGTSIPHQTKTLPELAHELGLEADALRERLESARRKLFAVRERRVHPLKDDKILTDWNGLMIAALAKGAQALNEPAYKEAARKAADFVLGTLRDDNGRLLKRYRQGRAGLPGHLEDYAFLVWGLLDLYEATFEPRYLREAVALNELMLKHFWDADSGGLFLTADDGEQLLVRGKEIYDGAIPSGNSAAALNLLRLARMTGRETYEERAQELMKAFSGTVSRSPSAYALLLTALDFAVGPSLEVVIAASPGTDSARALVRALREPYLPNKVVLFRESGVENPALAELAPFTEAMESLDGKATVYVCRNFACERPTTDSARMLELLTGKTPAR